MEKIRSVVVLGGGISGLSVAYYIQMMLNNLNKRFKITVLEKSDRIGGWIESTRLNNGAIFEHGPRSLRAGGVGLTSLNLVNSLGLSEKVLPILPSNAGTQNRFIYANGQLHTLPNSIAALFKKQPLFTQRHITSFIKEIFKTKKSDPDESIHSFMSRRFSKEIADYLVDALCIGIFAADSRHLSVRSCFPQLYDAEQLRGSVVLANLFPSKSKGSNIEEQTIKLIVKSQVERWSMWGLKGGLQILPETLLQTLQDQGVNVVTSDACTSIGFKETESSDKMVKIGTSSGSTLEADHLISTVPSTVLASLLPTSHCEFAESLSTIDSVDVAVVNLEYSGNVLPQEGFGYLIPSNQKCKLLGVIFDSSTFPENNSVEGPSTRLTCMMGGSWFQEYFGDSHSVDQNELLNIAKATVSDHLGIAEEPINTAVKVHHECIPTYQPGHYKKLENFYEYIRDQQLPMSLGGSSYCGVSVNDCIHNAYKTANEIVSSM